MTAESGAIEIPYHFFSETGTCLGEIDARVYEGEEVDFDGDLSFIDADVKSRLYLVQQQDEIEEFRFAIEYLMSIKDENIPENMLRAGVGTLGEFMSVPLGGVFEGDLHKALAHARHVAFPNLPPMTEADKAAARTRVRVTLEDLDTWRARRKAEKAKAKAT